MKNYLVLPIVIASFLLSCCNTYRAKEHEFPKPVDTTTKPIQLQEKKVYRTEQGVHADNMFDGARLNGFIHVKQDLFQATISPENTPINKSPYYAFRLWATEPTQIKLELNYTEHSHRYPPKMSTDGINWEQFDSKFVKRTSDSINVIIAIDLTTDTIYIAGQEVQNSSHVKAWCKDKARHEDVYFSTIGHSKLGRKLWLLDMYSGDKQKKDIIIIMCRQHPPEVTGYLAMQAFIDEVISSSPLAEGFRDKYRILVFPLMNPDGVDLGHWRHNAGGIDPNRDWAYYHQPENRQIADFIVRTTKKNKSKVIFGLDFHSTYHDVYYTNNETPAHIQGFKEYWLSEVGRILGEESNEKPSNVGAPVSKGWIYRQFGALGITYEIGDSTPRDFIKEKGQVSAIEMMKLLVLRK